MRVNQRDCTFAPLDVGCCYCVSFGRCDVNDFRTKEIGIKRRRAKDDMIQKGRGHRWLQRDRRPAWFVGLPKCADKRGQTRDDGVKELQEMESCVSTKDAVAEIGGDLAFSSTVGLFQQIWQDSVDEGASSITHKPFQELSRAGPAQRTWIRILPQQRRRFRWEFLVNGRFCGTNVNWDVDFLFFSDDETSAGTPTPCPPQRINILSTCSQSVPSN